MKKIRIKQTIPKNQVTSSEDQPYNSENQQEIKRPLSRSKWLGTGPPVAHVQLRHMNWGRGPSLEAPAQAVN